MKTMTRILRGVLLLLLPLAFTSCEWTKDEVADNPVTPKQETPTPPTYASDAERPLTIEAAVDGVNVTFMFKEGAKPKYKKVKYSLDGGATWNALKSVNQTILLEKAGDIVMFRGNNKTYNGDAWFDIQLANSQARSNTRATVAELIQYATLYGNISSLIKDEDFKGAGELIAANAGAFASMFKGAHIDAQSADGTKKLVLPVIGVEVVPEAFKEMFAGSTIQNAPKVIVETIGKETLTKMFNNCPELKTIAIELGFLADNVTPEKGMGDMLGGDTGKKTEGGVHLVFNPFNNKDSEQSGASKAAVTLEEVPIASNVSKEVMGNVNLVIGNGNDDLSTVVDDGVVLIIFVSELKLDKHELELTEKETATLKASIEPENASDKRVFWYSKDEKYVTVDQEGVVTAVAATTECKDDIYVYAKHGETYKDSCKVTVKETFVPVESISLDQTKLELETEGTATLNAKVGPDNASEKTVTWSSSDSTVVKVKDGELTALKAGKATITAKAGEKTATCEVTVKDPVIAVSSITLDQAKLDLETGSTATLKASVGPENATVKTVTWSTSDEKIATVKDGVVTAVAAGKATITATAGSKSATCEVTVKDPVIPVTSVTLSKTELTLEIDDAVTLKATVGPDNATDKTVTWSSSDSKIASVTNGKVTAVAVGTATITAKAGEKSDTCKVKVIDPNSATIDVTYGEEDL